MGTFPPLAVFAVFPGNQQRATSHFWRDSWAADDSAAKITAGSHADIRCFFAVFLLENSQSREPGVAIAGALSASK
jgi:hypothetical protein